VDPLLSGPPIPDVVVSTFRFNHWVAPAAGIKNGVKVGAPAGNDILIPQGGDVDAIAFYKNGGSSSQSLPLWDDPFWWIFTRGGRLPRYPLGTPDPPPQWRALYLAALALGDTARNLSPNLQVAALELAAAQIGISAAELKRQIAALKQGK
jgi:hypothetical protein